MNSKQWLRIFLILFLLADLAYSFKQDYAQRLDGDLVGGALPATNVQTVLNHPFGWYAIQQQVTYVNPNRFFSHWMLYHYFNNVPLFLQHFVNPIQSLYLAVACIKISLHLAFILCFAFLIVPPGPNKAFDILVAAAIITPLLQTNGYQASMGILNHAVTYDFFYALPVLLLFLFAFPLLRQLLHHHKSISLTWYLIWSIPASAIICLSSPLNPAVIVLFAALFGFYLLYNACQQAEWNWRKYAFATVWIPLLLMALYSLYLGKYNENNSRDQVTLLESYRHLPRGVFGYCCSKLGMPLILLLLATNYYLLTRFTANKKQLKTIYAYAIVFILLYILLLPLGGYRIYRGNFLQSDTALPITLLLLFMVGYTSYLLLQQLPKAFKQIYVPALVLVLLLFELADVPEWNKNVYQQQGLQRIANAKEQVVQLPEDCLVLTWLKCEKPEYSKPNAEMLYRWKVIHEGKLYYNK